MGSLNEFPLKIRLFLRMYPWRRIDLVPWAPLAKPVKECRIGLVSSAGFVTPEQAPFDDSIKGGDPSFREISGEIPLRTLRDTHRSQSFDHTGLQQDPNLAFPVDRLREMVEAKRIGSLNGRHLSFMGSIVAPGRFVRDTVPEMARIFVRDQVNLALFVPV